MKFEYVETKVKDIVAHARRTSTGKTVVDRVDIDGRPLVPTKRFWTALQANYGFSNNIFTYFTHKEVFDRISETRPDDRLSVCVEANPSNISGDDGVNIVAEGNLLAVANPQKVIVRHDDLLALLDKHGVDVGNIDYGNGKRAGKGFGRSSIGTGGRMLTSTGANSPNSGRILGDGITHNDGTVAGATPAEQLGNLPTVSYHDGIIRSIHDVRNEREYSIGGDDFCNKFILDIPIDGYGKPAAYLVLLRIICSNLAIGYSQAFRSDIALGKGEGDFTHALNRAIDGFNNEDGFNAIRDRFESAQKSWCSINEVVKAYKALVRLHSKGEVIGVSDRYLGANAEEKDQFEGTIVAEGSPIIKSFHKMVGDLHSAYGLANLDALAVKRQATLPAGATVYEMLNFLSETATHHATPAGARVLQAHIGDLVSAEYDLEGTVDKFGDWRDFIIKDERAAENLQMAQQL